MIGIIGFDADDTLWHTETLYLEVEAKLKQLLSPYERTERIEEELLRAETRNLQYFGYGIKGFSLSMIEAAIHVSAGRIPGSEIQQIIGWAKEMMNADIRLMEYAESTVAHLARSFPLMLVTKGDLLDQEAKLARSGLAPYFRYVEIVSDKTPERYAAILAKYRVDAERFLMVGNSLRSDILPVLALGGCAVYIPHELTWSHETAVRPTASNCAARRRGHGIYSMTGWLAGKCAFPLRRKPRRH